MTQTKVGYVVSGVAILFLIVDAVVKLLQLPVAMDATVALGLAAPLVFRIGVIEIICLAVYVVPATSVLGAVLLTGYLGGAIAIQLRAGTPLFTNVLFPVYVAALIWGGLFLREARLRVLVPIVRRSSQA